MKHLKFSPKIILRILFPLKNLSKENKKKLSLASLILIILLLPFIVYTLRNAGKSEAAWFNTNWSFRKSIAITAHTAAENNVYINLASTNALDTSDTSKFQADCGDLRFTDIGGNLLPYYIVSGCGTSTTVVHVFFKLMPAGAQTIYYYYGNPQVSNGFKSSDFSTEAANYTIGAQGSEENGPSPRAYLSFDEGTGTTAHDGSSNGNNGTLTGSPVPTWQQESLCVSGKCLFFGGSTSKVTLPNAIPSGNQFTISHWIKTASASGQMYTISNTANGNGYRFGLSTGKIAFLIGNGSFTETTCGNVTVNDNRWHMITGIFDATGSFSCYLDGQFVATVTFSSRTGFSNAAPTLGLPPCCIAYTGYMDEFKFYNYAQSASQVKTDFAGIASKTGNGAVLGVNAQNNPALSNGLIGYWKMDEATWSGTLNEVIDSSGTGNNATAQGTTGGKAYPTPAKFANGGFFDGVDDDIDIAHSPTLDSLNGFTNSYSISFWVKSGSPTSTFRVMEKSDGTKYPLSFQGTSTNLSGFIYDGSHVPGIVYGNIWNGQWRQVVLVVNNSTGKIYGYLDGNLISTVANTTTGTTANTSDIYVGNISLNGNRPMSGLLDEVRIYNRPLSPSDVQTLYNFAPGPVAYYNLEEGQGSTANDTSGYGNTGTWAGTGSHWTQGKYGKGGSFNGTDDGIDVTSATTKFGPSNAFTIEAWFYKNADKATNTVYVQQGTCSTNFNYGIVSNSNGTVSATVGKCGVGANTVSSSALGINQWHHAVEVFDGTNVFLYVDGVSIGSTAYTFGIIPGSDTNANIGNDPGAAGRRFTGRIDEVKIYNYARTSGQIVSDMNADHPLGGSPVGSQIGYWKMDEGYGTSTFNSGNGGLLTGTLTSMASPANANSGWTSDGKFAKALSFDGTDDYVSIGTNTSALKPTGSFTISGWFKTTASTQREIFQSYSQNTNVAGIVLGVNADNNSAHKLGILSGKNTGTTVGTDWQIATSTANVDDGKWHYGAGVYDGNKLYIYVDGILQSSVAWANNPAYAATSYQSIGALQKTSTTPTTYFNGQIDEVKIYSGALSASEVKIDYNHGATQVLGSASNTSGLTGGQIASNSASAYFCVPGDTSSCSSPIADLEFEEGSGSTTNDISGNANTGTWNGTLGSQWTQGEIGKGGKFNGTDNYVLSSNLNSYLNNSNPLTVEIWFYPTAAGVILDELGQTAINTTYHDSWIEVTSSGGTTKARVWNCTAITLGTANMNAWNHAVLTYTSGTLGGYLNGTAATSGSCTRTVPGGGAMYLALGATDSTNMGSGNYFSGKMDQFRAFSYVRTPAQVAWDYNRGAPLAYWKLDECQGTTVNDSSGNGLAGTITPGASGTLTSVGTCSTSTTMWGNGATGKYNSSLAFDGDDWAGSTSSVFPTLSTVSVSSWFKTSGSSGAIFDKYMAGFSPGSISLYLISGKLSSSSYTGGCSFPANRTDLVSTATVNDGNWHFGTVVYDGTNLKIYVDGTLRSSSVVITPGNLCASNGWSIGTLRAGSPITFFNGQIDDVRMYRYPLTLTQIKQVYDQGAGVRFGPAIGTP